MASYEQYDIKNEIIKHSNNQEKIIDIAQNDSNWHVRQFAVSYIKNEEVLKDILVNDSIQSVSIKAMERINDIDFLVDTCLNNPFSHIRLATLNRIIDESLLSMSDLADLLDNVALNDPNDFIVKIALENTDSYNPETLMIIAKSMRDEEIRKIAVSKITDGKVLADFALNDSSVFIRRESILNPNLCDLEVLADVIKNDDDEFNRYWACEKIDDRDYLLKLILDKSFYHRLDDLSPNPKLNCPEYFKRIFENSDEEYPRIVCTNIIRDKLFLDNIVLNESSDKIRLEAIKNRSFSNQDILKDLIFAEDNQDILFHAISKIKDKKVLARYIKTNLNDNAATLQAILNIDDVELLKELSKHQNPKIRLHAVRSLSNNLNEGHDSFLGDIALFDENDEICLEAAKAITDSYVLADVADKSSYRDVRLAALNKIPASKLLDNFLFARRLKIESIDDTKFRVTLRHLALDEKDDDIRRLAISKLNDKKILDQIISLRNDDSRIAQKRLNTLFEDIKRIDNELLLKNLISSDDSDVSYIAQKTLDDMINSQKHIDEINEISDIEELKRIINEDFNYYVRCEAEGKLENLLFNIRLDEIDKKENQDKLKDIVEDESFPLEIRNEAFLKITDEKFKEDYYMENGDDLGEFEKLNATASCMDCNNVALKASEMTCPECGGKEMILDEWGVWCKACGLVIHDKSL